MSIDAQKLGERIAVLVFPFAAANTFSFARKLVEVVSLAARQTILVSGKIPEGIDWPVDVRLTDIGIRLHYVKGKNPYWLSALQWIALFILAQFRMAFAIYRLRSEIDVILCSLGIYYQIPILIAKVLRKKIIVACYGNDALRAELNYGNQALKILLNTLARIEYALADTILVESLHLVDENELLLPQQAKLHNGALFISDLSHFSARPSIQRDYNLVGFIGRFVVEKGIQEYLQSIPLLLKQAPNLKFQIIGNGSLDREIARILHNRPWSSHVEWIKWVDHDDMPIYLSRLGLLVMPSYTEGLPNLALEALACRTPLLVSSVGGIPDLIEHEETGFLLPDRSPQALARSVLSAIQTPNLEEITQRGRKLVENNYSLDASARRYREILASLSL